MSEVPSPHRPSPAPQVYVLRLWKEGERPEVWRASLHDSARNTRYQFATFDALIEHLFTEMAHP
ncbi:MULTISPECIES: hypothetical protein [Deinococcus]|uniref:Uncharacterized protein n=1 Tax=Deinococcus hohokamensis TaxID=309883 RepID=A0ABV9I6I4_9DEIO